jgi:hypothetical protein
MLPRPITAMLHVDTILIHPAVKHPPGEAAHPDLRIRARKLARERRRFQAPKRRPLSAPDIGCRPNAIFKAGLLRSTSTSPQSQPMAIVMSLRLGLVAVIVFRAPGAVSVMVCHGR